MPADPKAPKRRKPTAEQRKLALELAAQVTLASATLELIGRRLFPLRETVLPMTPQPETKAQRLLDDLRRELKEIADAR